MEKGIQRDFEGIVCSELLQCWEEIVNYGNLTRVEAARVRRPVISLADSESFLGRWCPEGNRIEIRKELVHKHPWYAVLDVFYHEVAHQIRHFLYPCENETAHGARFREICARIGASPSASSSMTELDERLFAANASETADPIAEKVRKLLVLADKGDEHEAEVALAKAAEIMGKYGIDHETIDGEGGFVTISVGAPCKHLTMEDSCMLSLLSDFFSVMAITVRHANPLNGNIEHLRMICGTPSRVKVASYVYDSIQSHIGLAWAKYCLQNRIRPNLSRKRRDFAVGALQSLRDKLEKRIGEAGLFSLVHVRNAELDRYYHNRYPCIRMIRHKASHDGNALNAGRAAGRDIELRDGVTDGAPNSRLLKA